MRVAALVALMHLALDGPSIRTCLDARLEETARVRKAMWDEAKVQRAPLPPFTTLEQLMVSSGHVDVAFVHTRDHTALRDVGPAFLVLASSQRFCVWYVF